jgi:SpoU rRNA methylase family enzyme
MNKIMRFLVRAQIPTEAGNKMIKNPKFMQNLEEYIKKVNPEASYFFEAGGDRTFAFIVNIDSVDMIPSIAEPLFQDIGAKVEFHPVMVFEDLKKAMGHFG